MGVIGIEPAPYNELFASVPEVARIDARFALEIYAVFERCGIAGGGQRQEGAGRPVSWHGCATGAL